MIILVARGRGRKRGRGKGAKGAESTSTKGAGSSDAGSSGAGSSSGLRRSTCVKGKKRVGEEIEEEEEEEEEELEELLSSSQQIAFQPSTVEQSLSKQIASQPSSAEQLLPRQSLSQQTSSQQSSSQQLSSQQSSSKQLSSREPFNLTVNLDSLIIDPTDNRDIIIRSSRSHTPINMSPTAMQQSQRSTPSVEIPPNRVLSDDRLISSTAMQQSQRSTPSVEIPSHRALSDDRLTNIEAILIKQGKQNRAIYELQKMTWEKVSSLQNQIKKIKSDKSDELSQKVFNVSNKLICIILSH